MTAVRHPYRHRNSPSKTKIIQIPAPLQFAPIVSNPPFWGCCPRGITEYVLPVFYDKKMLCIIYLGNICDNKHETEQRTKKAANFTGVDINIVSKIPRLADGANRYYYEKTAHIIKSYILLLYQTYPEQAAVNNTHWIIKALHGLRRRFLQ